MDTYNCLFRNARGEIVDYEVIAAESGDRARDISLTLYERRPANLRHGAEIWRAGIRVAVIE